MKEIAEILEKFDKERGWYTGDIFPEEKRIEMMEWMVTGLAGELGEVSGPIHKFRRNYNHHGFKKEEFEQLKQELEEELADVYIFLYKLSLLVDVDLKKAILKKIKRNEERHAKFKK